MGPHVRRCSTTTTSQSPPPRHSHRLSSVAPVSPSLFPCSEPIASLSPRRPLSLAFPHTQNATSQQQQQATATAVHCRLVRPTVPQQLMAASFPYFCRHPYNTTIEICHFSFAPTHKHHNSNSLLPRSLTVAP